MNSEPMKISSSVHDTTADKPPFGSRFLTEDADVWSKNAWDHVPPPEDQSDKIAASLARQRNAPVPENEKFMYNNKPARHWDNFYKMNSNNFFRNRKWLHTEFPELVSATQVNAGPVRIAEIGCGAGNSVFPLLSSNSNPELQLCAFDYSNHAIKIVQNDPLYQSPPVGSIRASVWDLASGALPGDIAPGSVDIVVLIFVMSALHPNEWPSAISNIHQMLKPGGLVVIRDYGRHDLTQLRFKEGRLLDDNFYIRGDKTRVYFFELDDLALLFTGAQAPTTTTTLKLGGDKDGDDGDEFIETPSATQESHRDSGPHSTHPAPPPPEIGQSAIAPLGIPPHPLFSIEQLGVDRRLLINRKRQLKMYRVWMQGKFRKL